MINKKYFLFIAALTISLLNACSFLQKKDGSLGPTLEEKNLYTSANDAFEKQNYDEAEEKYSSLLLKYPNTYYKQASQLGLANVLKDRGQCNKAIPIYDRIAELARENTKELYGRTIYNRGLCYYELKFEDKYLASLLEAQAVLNKILPELSQVEIPAKLAAFYAAIGDEKISNSYVKQVERGLDYIQAQPDFKMNKEWLAKIYFNVGNIPTQELNIDNFDRHLESFSVLIKYLFRSIDLEVSPWSTKSKNVILHYLNNYWQIIGSINTEAANLSEAEKQQNKNKKSNLLTHYLIILKSIELLKPIENQTQNQIEVYTAINKQINEANNLLFLTSEVTPKTNKLKEPLNNDKKTDYNKQQSNDPNM